MLELKTMSMIIRFIYDLFTILNKWRTRMWIGQNEENCEQDNDNYDDVRKMILR